MIDPLDMAPELEIKKNNLIERLRTYESVLIAFSGGVDSTFLLAAARKALLRESILAVTAVSSSLAEGELERCRSLAALIDAPWRVVKTEEFNNPRYLSNPSNRCYFCKSELYSKLIPLAREGGYQAIINGLNLDDLSDIRPGQQAAVEAGVKSPLRDLGFKKHEIRRVSRAWVLPTWDYPEKPCLSSRVAFGTPVRAELLKKIDRAEGSIRALGFHVVRVRTNGAAARVEIGKDELPAIDESMKDAICRVVKDAGFDHAMIDTNGYARGSLRHASAFPRQ